MPAPRYTPRPGKVHARRAEARGVAPLIDWGFFVFGAVYAAWFAVLLARTSVSLTWWHLLYLVGFWLVASYLALPRLHRVLTEIYVPDYFIGRVRTPEGLLGDPVNLAFRGSAAQIGAAFHRAGWVVADPVTFSSSRRIVLGSLTGRSYPQAPVSPLLLFGRPQDVAFQQEVEDSPSRRHHVRLWRCPAGWYLPGGHQVDWLAAGTYDRAVGLSLFTGQVTHRIDADTDAERDYIVATLRHADREVEVDVIENFSTGYHHRNGGGDLIDTDGDLPVVDVSAAATTPAAPWPPEHPGEGEVAAPARPTVFPLAVAAVATGAVLQIAGIIRAGLPEIPETDSLENRLVAAGVLALTLALFYAPLLLLVLRGHHWARYVLLGILAFNGVADMATLLPRGPEELLLIATTIVAVVALSDRSASEWITALRAHRRAGSASGG